MSRVSLQCVRACYSQGTLPEETIFEKSYSPLEKKQKKEKGGGGGRHYNVRFSFCFHLRMKEIRSSVRDIEVKVYATNAMAKLAGRTAIFTNYFLLVQLCPVL